MKKKIIMHIVEAFGGGIFTFLVDLVNMTSEEFDIVILYGKREQTPYEFEKMFNKQVKFIEIKNFTRSINIKKDIKAFWEIKKYIKDIKPDIIHLHSSKAGFIGRFAVNDKAVKILYNPHGFSFLMKDSSKIKRLIYWGLEKIGGMRKCTVVGCSKGEYDEALKLTKNAIYINNSINLEKIEQEIKGLQKKDVDINKLKICTCGRINYQKNPDLFNEIANAFPNLEFTWIGDGDLRDKLTSSNIKITGWLSREESLKMVNSNDVFLLTSLWEGLPISLLEAMYLKKVCIVTDCIGNRDVINDGENGFIINKNNYKEIIENVDMGSYEKISEKAFNDIIENYNIILMVKKYIEVYRG